MTVYLVMPKSCSTAADPSQNPRSMRLFVNKPDSELPLAPVSASKAASSSRHLFFSSAMRCSLSRICRATTKLKVVSAVAKPNKLILFFLVEEYHVTRYKNGLVVYNACVTILFFSLCVWCPWHPCHELGI